jgi:rhamnosyltransferase
MAQKIVASILSWNPDIEVLRRSLKALRPQVNHVIICDNGSSPELQDELKKLGKEFEGFITFVWNGKNLGNAGGLNVGVQAALDTGAAWVMPIDDDSVASQDMVAKMLEAYNALSPEDQKRVGRVMPNYTTVKGMMFEGKPFITDGALSSGEIVKAEVYQKIGFYKEELFIDFVDSEFSHRAYRARIYSLIVPAAILYHTLGEPSLRKFLWLTAAVTNYPPYRYYYISRNGVYLYTRYFDDFFIKSNSKMSAVWLFIIPRYFIKAMLFEDQKMEKVRMVLKGTWDGLRGNMGKLQTR